MAKINIKLTPQQQQILVMSILMIGGGGFAYVKYFWLPISVEIKKTREEIDKVDKQIKTAKKNAGKLKQIQEDLDKLNKQAEETEKGLPQDEDFPGVVDTVTDLARKHNVNIKSFSTGSLQPQAHFIEISYTLSASGLYHDVGRFFASLSLEERIFHVRNVNFSSTGGEEVSISFKLMSYQYKG